MTNIEKLLYRVILGYYYITINNENYKIVSPDLHTKYEAEILYDKIIEDNKYDKLWLTDDEIKFQLAIQNVWSNTQETELKENKTLVENLKTELYLNFSNPDKKKKIKQRILSTNKKMDKLNILKSTFDYLSIKEHANTIKNEFLIMSMVKCADGSSKFNNPEKDSHEHVLLQLFIREILDNSINVKDLRQLARSDLFKSYASSCDLHKDIYSTSDDYRYLINLHKMYENAKQHPEAPSEEIMEDDDALDGWFIYHNRKAEKEKKKNAILERVGGNIKNAGEVFLLTDSQEETKEIFDLNDPQARANIAEMRSIVKEKGSANWSELPFVKRQIQNDLAAKFGNKG